MLPLALPAFHLDTLLTTTSLRPATPPRGIHLRDAFATPSPKKRSHSAMESASPASAEDADAAATWVRASRMRYDEMECFVDIEPLHAPCADEIPMEELLFWLGDNATGLLACACRGCHSSSTTKQPSRRPSGHGHSQRRRGLYLYIPSPAYSGLSAKIPVIAMPRIEGFN